MGFVKSTLTSSSLKLKEIAPWRKQKDVFALKVFEKLNPDKI